jgi:phosphoserine phosphatase RsbU/P
MNGTSANDPVSFLAQFNAPELLNLLADGAYITDAERKIVFWNRAAQRITGWNANEVVGHCCHENILVHVDKDGHPLCGHEHCPLHRCMVTGRPSAEPLLVFAQHRSGPRIPLEVTVSPVRDRDGRVIGGIEVFRDLTESMQDQLRAKEVQEMAVECRWPADDRVCIEMCYQPRDIVGGDFYRVERLDNGHDAILVADAMGHGIAAALHTMLLRSLWNEHRGDLESPARFMETVNGRLQPVVRDGGLFGTAVLASYDPADGTLRLVCAGHPRPLLFRSDGTTEAVGHANPALGISPDTSYTETCCHLQAGDMLLLYTDGATELFDADDGELGRDGLQKLVREQTKGGGFAALDLQQLAEELLRFSNQIHLPDDLTLVKLCRTR